MKKKFKIILDIIMYLLFIVLMGYNITGNLIHEILGTLLILFFIIHNMMNIKWYKTLFKGKMSGKRLFKTIINLSMCLMILGFLISGIMISNNVFKFLNIPASVLARNIHMICNSWGLVIMSLHVAMHVNHLIDKLNKKLKNSTFEYVIYLIEILLMIFGLYSIFQSKLLSRMFLQISFVVNDDNLIIFYLKYISITIFIIGIYYIVNKLIIRKKEKIIWNIQH